MDAVEQWEFRGERFSTSFNPRRAIASDRGRIGYLKVLAEGQQPDPWLEQWANEQIVAALAQMLAIPVGEAYAGWVEGEPGAVTVLPEGRKLSELALTGYRLGPLLDAAVNRDQLGLIVAFDVWVLNDARRSHNLFVSDAGRPQLGLLDHGRTLFLPREGKGEPSTPEEWHRLAASGLVEDVASTDAALASYLREWTTPEEILVGAQTIADLEEDRVAAVVDAVPDAFLFCPRTAIAELLNSRKRELAAVLEEAL